MSGGGCPTQPSDEAVRAWTRLNRAQTHLSAQIERRLKAAGLPPLCVYDVLLELTRAPDGRLRQVDLRRKLLFAQYSISRLVDRLESEGLVAIEPCPVDQRARWVTLTAAGRAAREAAWPVYARAIAELVDGRLSTDEAAQAAALLERLYRP